MYTIIRKRRSQATPFTLCKNEVDNCDGVVDALGMCVCGSEIRKLLFRGTFSDDNCTDLVEELPQLPIAMDACFHFPAGEKIYSIKVSCLINEVGANFQLWDGQNCGPGDPVAEANVFPDRCIYGDLESFVRGRDIWVVDNTCSDDPVSQERYV